MALLKALPASIADKTFFRLRCSGRVHYSNLSFCVHFADMLLFAVSEKWDSVM
jgi:hypothetical protein